MKGNMGAHLREVTPKYVARSRKNAPTEEAQAEHPSDRGQAMKRRVRTIHEQRVSRVETLRAQVRAGFYQVNTQVLAERMLENETHFVEGSQE